MESEHQVGQGTPAVVQSAHLGGRKTREKGKAKGREVSETGNDDRSTTVCCLVTCIKAEYSEPLPDVAEKQQARQARKRGHDGGGLGEGENCCRRGGRGGPIPDRGSAPACLALLCGQSILPAWQHTTWSVQTASGPSGYPPNPQSLAPSRKLQRG